MTKCMILCREKKIERIVDIFNTLFTGTGNNLLTLAPYVSSQSASSTRAESTIFDQVYSGYRRRPAMISLNVQWIPVNNRSGAYQLSGSDISNQKVKTVTFFGTGQMRGQQQAKVITPPGSDYTDAYLSAFASKSIPTRHVHRLSTSIFDNSAPIPLKPTSTPISTSSSIKTSETRFINTNNIQTWNSFDKPTPSSSNRSSTYSSSFVPERSTTYEPLLKTQYSTPPSQTFTSSYSTLLRSPTSTTTSTLSPSIDSQRSYTTFQTRSQPPPSSTYPIVYRSETVYENIYKPMPPYSIQTYPPSNTYTTSLSSSSTESTYKPYVPSQSFPLSSSYNINQSSISERTVLPTTKIEKQVDRPETLLFQHDEDIRSSQIEKPSPISSPSLESPMNREELKVEPERLHMEELPTTTSAPIKILENTLSKYDSLINQISEVLASVSPLSSTVSSMSPGKSVLDYQLSSDTSPILPHKPIESEISQQSTTTSTAKSSDIQRTKASHLIREDSYDKIVTAISDLDSEIISPTIKEETDEAKTSSLDESQVPSIAEEDNVISNISSVTEYQAQLGTEQEKEETKTPSTLREETKTLSFDEPQALSVAKEEEEETKTTSTDKHQGPSVTEAETKTSSLEEYQTAPINEEEKKEETQTASIGEQQTSSTTEDIKEETKTSYTDEQAIPSVTEEAKTSPTEEQQVSPVSKVETKTSYTDEQAIPSVTEEAKTSPTEEQQVSPVSKEETKTSSTDESQTSFVTEEEKKEEKTNVPEDEHQAPSSVRTEKDEEEETKTSYTDEQATPSVTEEEKEESKTAQAEEQQVSVVSKEEEETKTSFPEESQTSSITKDEKEKEITTVSLDEHSVTSPAEEKTEETIPSSTDEYQLSAASEAEKVEMKTPSSEEYQASSVTEQEHEETKIESSQEHQIPSAVTEEKEETKISLSDEQQVPSVSEEPQSLSAASSSSSDTSANEILQSNETKSDEEKVADGQLTVETTSQTSDFVQQQTGLLSNVPNDAPVTEEQQETSVNVAPTKKIEKHVRWDETVVDNEDEESSSCQSLTEESSTPEASITTTYDDNSTAATELGTTIDQQLISSDITEPQITFDQTSNPSIPTESSITLSSIVDQQVTLPDSAELQSTSIEQQISPSSHLEDQANLQTDITEKQIIPSDSTEQQIESSIPLETSSTFSDSTNQQLVSSDATESQLGLNEQQFHSTSPTDSSKEDIFTINEVSTTTPDVISNEDISKSVEEPEAIKTESKEEAIIDEHKVETSSLVAESTTQDSETSVIESTTGPLEPTIVSPIDTIAETVSNRYISSDVYHGYLGEHQEFLQDTSDVDNDSTTKSLLASLRETITAPITPLIETIQSVVSSMQTTHPSKTQSETTNQTEDETRLTAAVVTESTEEVSDDKTQTEENEPTVDTSEKLKTVFENLREAVTAPITAITETIQTAVSNLQSDKQGVPSTSDTEQLKTALEENVFIAAAESSSDIVSPSDEQTDDHSNKEIEPTQSSLLDSIQEKVSKTITTLTEAIQNVVSTETHTEDEQAVQKEKSDTQSSEHSVPADTVRDETLATRPELSDSFVTDSTISTSLNSSSITAELENEQKQQQETTSVESLPSEIQEFPSTDQKSVQSTTESVEITPVIQHDEQLSTPTVIPSEQVNIVDKQEAIPSEISIETPVEPKLDENASTETKTTLEVIRDVIAHPLAAISDKIQSIIPSTVSEQTVSDATETSKEQQQLSETENVATIEQKTDSIVESENTESSETKTTLETIRDVITHPLATITEKIQSVISSSSTEEVPSSEQQSTTDQKKNENITSTVTESTFETTSDTITNPSTEVNETVDDVVSNTTDQTSSSQEKEQILTTQGSEVYSQDQIQGGQEISSINIPSQISDDEKTIQITESESEHAANADIQDLVSHRTVDATTTDTNQLLINNIRDLINDTINTVITNLNRSTIENEQIHQEIFSSDSGLTSPITVPNVEDKSESSQSTINQEKIINMDDITWNNLVGEKSSDEKLNESYEEIVQSPDNTTSALSNQTSLLPIIENTTQQTINTPQIDDVMQRSSNEFESDSTSAITEIEKVPSKSSIEFREPSLSNTDDDSFELIHALHGHSIITPSSPVVQTTTNQPPTSTSTIEKTDEQILQAPERSSSSTTSSQITSSDRYVSYAIHELGDSSQERLPAFPLAADIPIYKSVKTTSDENREHEILSEPIVNVNQNITKDDDLTELDATENLTSYSDDNLLQKLHASAPNRQDNLDASSTDEDVDDENFNEFDQHDTSNLHRIIEKITQQNNSLSGEFGQTYQRYDVSNASSTSTKPQTDDVYIIPGYPGLWRPSADDIDDDNTRSSLANDADDEDEKKQSTSTVKTRTIVRTTNPAKLQSFLQQQHQDLITQEIPLRPDTIDIFNRPLNEFTFDLSESDSFKTCPSTINSSVISKQQKQSELFDMPILEQQEHQISPEEKIFLIRERERGVSLPVTMKIDYDNMALRLSASTPIDAQLYSTSQTDLPSPSTHSEPIQKTTSSSRASTPSLSSNESEQQKLPSSSWLNTINTTTTTTEGPDGPLESRTTIHKSAKGPISIAECDPQGKFIIIENTSRSKSIALASWTIRQENDSGDILTFTFPDNCLLRPNQSLKVFTKPNESERRNSDLIASLLSSWHTGSNVVTTLINAEGKDRASLTKKTLFS